MEKCSPWHHMDVNIIAKLSGVLLLALPLTCLSQYRLKGTVLDAQTREVLPWVNVELPGLSTVTDADGHFEVVSKMPEQTVTVSFIGYVTQTVQLRASQEVVIELSLDPNLGLDPTAHNIMASLDVGYFGDGQQAPMGFMMTMPIQSVGQVPLNLYSNFKYWKSGTQSGMDVSLSKTVRTPLVDNLLMGYRSIDYNETGFVWKQARGLIGKHLPLGFAMDAGATYSELVVFEDEQRLGENQYWSALVGLSKNFRYFGRGDWGLYTNLTYNAHYTYYEAALFKEFRIGKLPPMTVLGKYYNYDRIDGIILSLAVNIFSTRYYCCNSWLVHHDYFSVMK